MAEKSRGGLFRTRNILGSALIAGIGLGVYLGQFKGFGLGGSGSWGIGEPIAGSKTEITDAGDPNSSPEINGESESAVEDVPSAVPDFVSVVIDDRRYLVRQGGKDRQIELAKLIKLIKQAPGDSDGVRVRIYERPNTRMRTEEDLKSALLEAGIPDTAVLLIPNPVK